VYGLFFTDLHQSQCSNAPFFTAAFVKYRATIPDKNRVSVRIRRTLSQRRGGVSIKWHAETITSPYFFWMDSKQLFALALKLLDKGKRKEKRQKSLPNKAGTGIKKINLKKSPGLVSACEKYSNLFLSSSSSFMQQPKCGLGLPHS
jgi:hypothetical protein